MLKKFLIGTMALALMLTVASSADAFSGVTLRVGSRGADVMELQTLVGATPVDGVFGNMTKAKVMAWQANNGLVADGVFGPASIAKANGTVVGGTLPAGCQAGWLVNPMTGASCTVVTLPAGCQAGWLVNPMTGASCTGGTVVTPGVLVGGIGELAYSLTSGIGNEEVGEGQDDVKVMGLKLEATDSESDVSVTSAKIEFVRSGAAAATDFEDVAGEVSVWLGTTEVARVDADVFNDDNDETKTIGLLNAVVKMDTKADLFVKVSGASNIDGTDLSDDWTVEIIQVRYVDAQGAITTDTVNEGAETFSFESFASSADVELAVALKSGETAINEAHVINIDDSSSTDAKILAFTVEAKGDSDMTIDELPVLLTSNGFTLDVGITEVELFHGSDSIASESTSVAGTTEVITFENLDLTIDAGDKETFYVQVTLVGTDDGLTAGDTIKAEIDGTRVDLIVAEDETGEEVTELTGTAATEASTVYDIGMTIKLVSVDADKTAGVVDATTPTSDEGDFKIVFDVTAFDGDIYVDGSAPEASGGTGESDLTVTGAGTLVATITSDAATADNTTFLVEEGTTERFTIDANILATTTGYFKLALGSVAYALSAADATTYYNFDLDTFVTGQLYLTDR
jgi:hypothetical protein